MLALLILVAIGLILAFGVLLGWLLSSLTSRDAPLRQPSWQDDLAAASRMVQRLADQGAIDEETRRHLMGLLREANLRHQAPTPNRAPASALSPPIRQETTSQVEAPAAPRNDTALARATGDIPLDAEIVEQAPPPVSHPLDAPDPVVTTVSSPSVQRRRAVADLLQAFMEAKNIRWGELVSGVLIVGCSIALVISLRHEIESLSERFIYMPALLFMLATAAIHAAGNYTLRRWNLQATSRGVLIIATLLIPINFLAAIVVTGSQSRQLPLLHPLYLSAVVVGVLSFGAMAFFAGQALMRKGRWRLWIGVMGTSVGQLIINRVADRQPNGLADIALVALPLAAFLVATIGQLRVSVRRPRIGMSLATDLLLVLGVTSFALAAPIGLLLSRADSLRAALAWLSTPLCLPSVVILATGLAISHRVVARRLATVKTIGTSLAIFGGFMMLAAVLLAWPQPDRLIAVGLFSCVALTFLASVGRTPVLHMPAIACGTLAYLIGFHLLQDAFAGHEGLLAHRMLGILLMGRSSVALAVLATVVAGGAGLLFYQGRRTSGLCYLAAGCGIAMLSVVSALFVGFFGSAQQDPNLAAPVLLFYAVVVLSASYVRPTMALTWSGSALLLVASVQGLAMNEVLQTWLAAASLDPERPVLVAVLLHGLVVATAASLLLLRDRTEGAEALSPRRQQLINPLTSSGLGASVLVLPFAIFVSDQQFGEHAWYVATVSVIWCLGTWVQRSPIQFSVFQALATTAVAFTVASICQQQRWWNGQLYSPPHLQAQFGTIAVWCLGWSVGRRLASRRWPQLVERMRLGTYAVDEMVLTATVMLMFAMGIVGCAPEVAIELGIADASSFSALQTWHNIFTSGSWIAAVLLLAAVTASLAERFTFTRLSCVLLVIALFALLVAGSCHETVAVASTLRWAFAVYGTVMTIAVCWGSRIDMVRRLDWLEWQDPSRKLGEAVRSWTLILSAIPIVGLTTASLVQAAAGSAPGGPALESFFSRIGSELSYSIPLGLLVAVFVAHAIREKKTSLMLAGSGVFQYLVNLAFFLPIVKDPYARLDWPTVITWSQWNCVGLAVYTLAWLGMRRWLEPRDRDARRFSGDPYLARQEAAVIWALVVLIGLAHAVVFWTPSDLTAFAELGNWLSYLACTLGFASLAWCNRARLADVGLALLFCSVLAIGAPLAISIGGAPGSWVEFHVLMIVWLSIAMLATTLSWVAPRWRNGKRRIDMSVRWATAFVSLSVLLALRAAPFDPQSPWWSFGVTLSAAVLCGVLGFRRRSQMVAYASTLIAAIAVTIVWWGAWPNDGVQGAIELVQLDLIAVVVSAMVWLFAELRYQFRLRRSFSRHVSAPAVHRSVAIGTSVLLLVIVFVGFCLTSLMRVSRSDLDVANLTGWMLLLPLGGLLFGSLWDRRMKAALAVLYTWGVTGLLMALDDADQHFDFDQQTVFVGAGMALAAYVCLTGHVWRFGANLAALGEQIGIPEPVSQLKRTSAWLPNVTLALAVMIVFVELCIVLTFQQRWMRVSAAFTPLLLAYGVGCQAQQSRRGRMQYTAMILASVSAVYAAWADIEPGWHARLVLERAVRLLMVLAGLAFLYAVPLVRWTRQRGGDWYTVILRMSAYCGVAALVTLTAVLLLEMIYFEPGVGVPFGHPYQVIAVVVVLVGLIIALLTMALSPQRDLLSLSESGRMGYVYAAQVVSALLFVHVYLSDPQLFGVFKPYWPYIVMGIAFAGVGFGEIFRSSGLPVLAEPLQRTAGFLPLLPALGWWLNERLGIDTAGHYSLLLFFVGLAYVALSMLRRSTISGIAAALAGNGAIWALLADYEPISLLKHPQFWLIPPAVSTLVAAHVNRRHITETQLASIRYLCLLVIYVSSTADILIEGVGDNLWEPMVLATLSVIGVFVGVGLRIRAFVYLGATFVFLSVVSMVWHAYANIRHVAIWWAFGIALGIFILTIFGLFEKKRPELMRVVERMRTWKQ